MNLQLITTGDFRPTCSSDGVHNPITWGFAGTDIRVIFRPNLPADRALAFVKSDVAKALGYKRPADAGESLGLVEGEDKGSERIRTPGGPQKLTVLTFKGLSKFLMRSTHQAALQFQDWLAAKSSDLAFYGIAIRDGDRTPIQSGPTADEIATALLNQGFVKAVATEMVHQLGAPKQKKQSPDGVTIVKKFIEERLEPEVGHKLMNAVLFPELHRYLNEHGVSVGTIGSRSAVSALGRLVVKAGLPRNTIDGNRYTKDLRLKAGLRLVGGREAI